MTTHPTLERRAPSVPTDTAPAHLARVVETPPTRLAMLGLVGWIALCALAASHHAMLSWHYFATAGQTLLSPSGGLHVYGEHPELQFGPLTTAVCALLGLAPAEAPIACVLMLVLGLAAIGILGRVGGSHRGCRVSTRTAMVYVALLAPLWLVLAVHYGHLDDALALLFMAAAVAQGSRDRWLTSALLLAAASGAKPWVVPMAMILLAAPRPARLKASTIFVVGTVLPWIPFVLADSRTMQLSRFVIDVADDSVLRRFGSLSLATPTWVRPTQFLLGAALAVWLVRRGRWVCVPFAVLSVRLLTDPQTYLYYSTGLALAAAIADLTRNDRRPILTGLVVGWSAVTTLLATSGQLASAGTVRLVGLLAGVVAVIVDDGWSPATARGSTTREEVRTTAMAQRPTQRVTAARPAVTPPATASVAPVTARIDNTSRIEEHPTVTKVTTFTMEKLPDPPKLGELWTQTRRPLRPSKSSRLIRR